MEDLDLDAPLHRSSLSALRTVHLFAYYHQSFGEMEYPSKSPALDTSFRFCLDHHDDYGVLVRSMGETRVLFDVLVELGHHRVYHPHDRVGHQACESCSSLVRASMKS
jgi:hypothetical protein